MLHAGAREVTWERLMVPAANEAMRIVRTLQVDFPTGQPKTGSAFLAPHRGRLITCAHVVVNEQGQRASRVLVKGSGVSDYEGRLVQVDDRYDLASLEITEAAHEPVASVGLPDIGETVIFSGRPAGVAKPSV